MNQLLRKIGTLSFRDIESLIARLEASGEFTMRSLEDELPEGYPNMSAEQERELHESWERDYLPEEDLKKPFALCLMNPDPMGGSLRGELYAFDKMPSLKDAFAVLPLDLLIGLHDYIPDAPDDCDLYPGTMGDEASAPC